MPVQATAISTGAPGCMPGSTSGNGLNGGGSVESFAFSSILTGAASAGGASITTNRWYSLCDIAGCSSAFFAEYLLQYINVGIEDVIKLIAAKYHLTRLEQGAIELLLKLFLDLGGRELLPNYNYWPLGEVSASDPANVSYGFSDDGDFDDTGILGILAQTDVNCIVAFINSKVPLSNVDGAYFLDGSLPLLFGSYYPGDGKPYEPYKQMNPAEPMSYVQVFDNSNNQLGSLCAGLYNAVRGHRCAVPSRNL
jgi:hypothetical protein